MEKELVKELESILGMMSLPQHRKTIRSHDSIRWLARNLQVKNSDHKELERAQNLIKAILKCKK